MILALLVLSVRLGENIEDFVGFEKNDGISAPTIMYTGDFVNAAFRVYVDNVEITTTTNFITAYKVMFAAYYVFNLGYPKNRAATMTYIQKAIINIQDKTAVIRKVSSFTNNLFVFKQQLKR